MKRLSILLLLSLFNLFTAVAQNYVFQQEYSNYTSTPPSANFTYPYGLATTSSGNIVATDFTSGLIHIVSPTGVLISEFGGSGNTDGKFTNPSGVAVDPSGNIYVADRGNHRIQKFTSSGVFISKWGSVGNANGQFNTPSAIAIYGTSVYVTDMLNNRIQVFNLSGAYQSQWGSAGTGNAQFDTPAGITTDAVGSVYVSDRLNHRIQKFTSLGAYTTQWGTQGSGDGQFNSPMHLKSDASNNIYVVDYYNTRIQKFTNTGTFTAKWGTSGTADNQFYTPIGITIVSGNVVVVDANYFRTFTSTGTFVSKFSSVKKAPGQYNIPNDVTLDAAGNKYVLDYGNSRIQKLGPDGTYISQFNYTYNNVSSIALTNNGTSIYIVSKGDNRVYKSGAPGSLIGVELGNGPGTGIGQYSGPIAICVDNLGNKYVVEESGRRVQKFNSSDSYVTKWGTAGSGDGQFFNPKAIAADNSGNIYVAEQSRIQKFSNTGTFILKWGSSGAGNGQFNIIKDIATDAQGNVYVTDGTRVQKFDGNGTYLTSWGVAGTGTGEFASNTGIFVNATGTVFVADATRNNIQTFVVDKEIKVVQGTTEIVSGAGTYDFGAVTIPANSADITFTISNTGSLPLALTGSPSKISLLGGNSSDFTVSQSSVPASLASGESTTFTIRFTPSAVGIRSTTLVIASDDTDENPYTITLTGTGMSNQTITSGGDLTRVYGAVAFTPTSSASSGLNVSYSSGNPLVATVSGNVITIVGTGASVITVSQSGNTYFNAAPSQTFMLTVNKKNLTITADDKTREEGVVNPAFTYTITGFVYNEPVSVLTGAPALSCSATPASPIGDYGIDITIGSLYSDNYNFIFQPGVLTVSQPTVVTSAEYAKTINLYPNPSNGSFNIDTQDQIEQVTVIDATGRKEIYIGQSEISTSFKGLVVLEVITDKGTAYIKALVK
jgi:hypothetical protein